MKHLAKKTISTVLVLAMFLSVMAFTPFSKETAAYSAGEIAGTTGAGQVESDPVVVNTFAELDAALRNGEIKYVKAVAPASIEPIKVSSDTGNRNVLSIVGKKHLTVEGVWDFSSDGTCDHLINVSTNTLELDGTGTIRYEHNKVEGTGAVFKVHSVGKLIVLSESITIEGYGNADFRDFYGDTIQEEMNLARAIWVDGGTLETHGGVYKGVRNDWGDENARFFSSVYLCNDATAVIDGGTFTTEGYKTAVIQKGGLHIIDSPEAEIKSGVFKGIKVESSEGNDSIYEHLYLGTRMIDLENDKVFNTRTAMTLTNTRAVDFNPYRVDTFTLDGKTSTGKEAVYSANVSMLSKVNDSMSFSFNVTPISEEMYAEGFTCTKSFAIKDSSVGTTAVGGGKETDPNRQLSGQYIFKKAGRVVLNCFYNFYYHDEHIFSWMTETVFNVQEGTEIGRVELTVERIKSNYKVPAPVVTTANNLLFTYYWYKLDENGEVDSGALRSFGELVGGEKYRLELRIFPAVGYSFGDSTKVYVNGQKTYSDNVTDDGVWFMHVDFTVPRYTLEILGTNPPLEGDSTTEFHGFDEANYDFMTTKTEHYWCTSDGQPFTGTFVAGETYYKCWTYICQYYGTTLPALDDITITIDGAYADENDVFMDSSGVCLEVFKEFVCVAKGDDAEEVLLGDVNGDGWVDSLDAALILQYDAGIKEDLSDSALKAADVNGDDWVDSIDASMILRYDAGIIEDFT